MKRYILTSDHFAGSVMFGYSEEGWLTYLNNEAVFNDNQHAWLFEEKRFPKRIESIAALAAVVKGELKELPPDISIESFWNAFDNKINLKRVKPLYEKLGDDEKLKAIMAIKPYHKYCLRNGIAVCNPEKYIRSSYWENDWARLK